MIERQLSQELQHAAAQIRLIEDYPEDGVLFRDITPVLADGPALAAVVADLAAHCPEFDVVAGIEARGFILAGALGVHTQCGALSVRKAGKLPAPAAAASYSLEYGEATVEVQQDIKPGARVLILDDVLATGGTADAARRVIEAIGGEVVGFGMLCEVAGLGGREKLGDLPIHVVFP
ncbi:adenine phosphoribosyltransferase [Canibacter zhoujuaniae]|uniref:adenine phosphoribosyltransferase n=1 Tax=Canibacter zhoujuaniae TaxID=2708343 RepID=UPI00141E93B7|nr:adenine phosphoribosyltransferase [Canibacter zhoujuaniae]